MLKYATVAFIFCFLALALTEGRANLFSILGFGNLITWAKVTLAKLSRISIPPNVMSKE